MKLKITVAGAALLLTACAQLPRELRSQIDAANNRLTQSGKDFERTDAEVLDDIKRTPDLFNGTSVATGWPAGLHAAKSKLDAAGRDRAEIDKLSHSSDKEAAQRARRLLNDEDRLRKEAIDEANSIEAAANRWLDFQRNLPHYLAKMRAEHDALHPPDLTSLTPVIEKAEADWPAKRADLNRRLDILKAEPIRAEAEWRAAGDLDKAPVPKLIELDNSLEEASHLDTQADDLRSKAGQLYNAWDKILEDLDNEHGDYRERVKIVQTRGSNVSTAAKWEDISPAEYRAVENDLGMAIAHKDLGLYDSEAQHVAQPAGFAYIAPPSAGSNQYGYWSHTSAGSFWTFLPQYLIMRELFWGNSYRPVVIDEYNNYSSAQRVGRTYYGESTPAAPPKYGTHGTFTQQRYATSRYVQKSGGSQPHMGEAPNDNRQGKRFGNGAGGPPPGKRFGSPGGFRPSGKSFGRRR